MPPCPPTLLPSTPKTKAIQRTLHVTSAFKPHLERIIFADQQHTRLHFWYYIEAKLAICKTIDVHIRTEISRRQTCTQLSTQARYVHIVKNRDAMRIQVSKAVVQHYARQLPQGCRSDGYELSHRIYSAGFPARNVDCRLDNPVSTQTLIYASQ